jgi:hypothetical protein
MAGDWFTAAACARGCIGDCANVCLPPSSGECGGLVDHCAALRKRSVFAAGFCYSDRSGLDWLASACSRFLYDAQSDSGPRRRRARSRDRLTRPRRILDRRTHVRPSRNPHPRNASTIVLDHSGKGFVALRLYFAAARCTSRVAYAENHMPSLFVTYSGHFVTCLPQKPGLRCF